MVIIPKQIKTVIKPKFKFGGGKFSGGGAGGTWTEDKPQSGTDAIRGESKPGVSRSVSRLDYSGAGYRTSRRKNRISAYDQNLINARRNAERKRAEAAAEKARIAREADRAASLKRTQAEAQRRAQQQAANLARQQTYQTLKYKQERYREQERREKYTLDSPQKIVGVLNRANIVGEKLQANPSIINNLGGGQSTGGGSFEGGGAGGQYGSLLPTRDEFKNRIKSSKTMQAVASVGFFARPTSSIPFIVRAGGDIRQAREDYASVGGQSISIADQGLKVVTKDLIAGGLNRYAGITSQKAGKIIATGLFLAQPQTALGSIVKERSVSKGISEQIKSTGTVMEGFINEYRDEPLKQISLFGAGAFLGSLSPIIGAGVSKAASVLKISPASVARASTALKIGVPVLAGGIKAYQLSQLETRRERELSIGSTAADLTSFGLGVRAGTPRPNVEIRQAGQTQRIITQNGDGLRYYDDTRTSALGRVGNRKYVLSSTGEARGTVTGRDLLIQSRGTGTITNVDLKGNPLINFKYGDISRGIVTPTGSQASGTYIISQNGKVVSSGRSITLSTGNAQNIQTVNFGFSNSDLASIGATKSSLAGQLVQGGETVNLYKSVGTLSQGKGVSDIIKGFGNIQSVAPLGGSISTGGTSASGGGGTVLSTIGNVKLSNALPISAGQQYFSQYLGVQASAQASSMAGGTLLKTAVLPVIAPLFKFKTGGKSATAQVPDTKQLVLPQFDQLTNQKTEQITQPELITQTGQDLRLFQGSSGRTQQIIQQTQITTPPPPTIFTPPSFVPPPPITPVIGGFIASPSFGEDAYTFGFRPKRVKGSQYLPSLYGLSTGETIKFAPGLASATGVRLPVARSTTKRKKSSNKKKPKKTSKTKTKRKPKPKSTKQRRKK